MRASSRSMTKKETKGGGVLWNDGGRVVLLNFHSHRLPTFRLNIKAGSSGKFSLKSVV